MEETCDIAVVGAGAAGLAAAIFAAETAKTHATRPLRVALLDGARTIGAKILISGGGRCNVTHDEIHLSDFNGSRPIVRNVLAAFDEHATVRWFASLGVPLKREETGKLFPVSDSARSVLDALLRRCKELNIRLLVQRRVTDVLPPRRSTPLDEDRDVFRVQHAQGTLRAQRVVLATGGRSLPRTGSDGTGWEIVRRLGHSVTATYPALVPLVLRADMFHARLSGLSQPVELSTFADGKLIDRRTGSLLWTHFGISGPVVMDASRHWVVAQATGRAIELQCSFVPGRSFSDVENELIAVAAARPRLSVRTALAAALPERLAAELAQRAGIDPALPIGQLQREPRRRLLHLLAAFPLPVDRARGWDYAEVTAGGVPLAEIDYRSMESRQVPGLYLVGELLDCDGRIGGYNFQWAWATGYVAGRAAATACARVRA